jgi:hypothetical protein
MRLAATILIVTLMSAALGGLCHSIGLSDEWCGIAALAGWSSGLLVLVGLWAGTVPREGAEGHSA